MSRRLCALPVVATVALLAGCGGSDAPSSDADKVRSVISDLGKAARAGDGAKICDDLFTQNLKLSIANASGRSCPVEVGQNVFQQDARFDVEAVTITGTNATAKVTDQAGRSSNLLLQRQDGVWRIARIG